MFIKDINFLQRVIPLKEFVLLNFAFMIFCVETCIRPSPLCACSIYRPVHLLTDDFHIRSVVIRVTNRNRNRYLNRETKNAVRSRSFPAEVRQCNGTLHTLDTNLETFS